MGASGRLTEYRGLSFNNGGDANATSVANFLNYFNPQIVGSSQGSHLVGMQSFSSELLFTLLLLHLCS
jgi:hypothetical protein